jgi:hypothetical protein
MKYLCLGYLVPGKFENMSESERNTVLDECFNYNDESRNSAHFPISGSEIAVWNNRDTSSGGYNRNHERERAATAKGHLAMRAATRERMISIMAEAVSDFGHQLAKTTIPCDAARRK